MSRLAMWVAFGFFTAMMVFVVWASAISWSGT